MSAVASIGKAHGLLWPVLAAPNLEAIVESLPIKPPVGSHHVLNGDGLQRRARAFSAGDHLRLAQQLAAYASSTVPKDMEAARSLVSRTDAKVVAQALHAIHNDIAVARLLVHFRETRRNIYTTLLFWLDFYSPLSEVSNGSLLRDRVERLTSSIYVVGTGSLHDIAEVKSAVLGIMLNDPLKLVGDHREYGITVVSLTQEVGPRRSRYFSIVATTLAGNRHSLARRTDYKDFMESQSLRDQIVSVRTTGDGYKVIEMMNGVWTKKERFVFDREERLVEETADGKVYRNEYNAYGDRLMTNTYQDGILIQTARIYYDDNGEVNGATTQWYDSHGNVIDTFSQ